MSKRIAEKELTDRNWQDEDEPEEAGEFQRASKDIIGQRVIKTAKRRHVPTSNTEEKPSLFAGFGGFGGNTNANLSVQPTISFPKITDTNTDTKPLFSFPAKTETKAETNGNKPAASPTLTSTDISSIQSIVNSVKKDNIVSSNPFQESETPKSNDNITDAVFLRKLKKLNESVIKFATEHIQKNPFVILTNVFNDYENHLERLQSESSDNQKSEAPKIKSPAKESQAPETVSKPETKPFSFGGLATVSSSPFGTTSSGFSFKPSAPTDEGTSGISGGFSFKPSTPSAGPSLFGKPVGDNKFTGFGALVGKPSSASDPTTSQAVDTPESSQEADDEKPPEPEKVDHVEKDALYHIKCKLFLKSGSDWNEKGLGTANLTSCNGKVQLLVRNDTTMGTVVLNTLLYENIPITRSGKNGIMIVVTSADMKSETYLCRVNKDKVEEFYEKLVEYKKGAPSEDS